MAEALPLPIRVLVEGASMVTWTSWMGGPRSDLTYPRVIDHSLHQAGHPSEVRVTATANQRVRDGLAHWEQGIARYAPDVVVLNYAHAECLPLVLPRWLERHANSLRKRPGRIREGIYRKRILRPSYIRLARLQARVDRSRKDPVLHRRLARTMADLRRLIERIDSLQSPLVLVLMIVPHGKTWWDWFPGAQARMDATNEAMRALVASFDKANIRIFETIEALERGAPLSGDEEWTPDGGHFTPRAHRAIGEGIASEILGWAADQPHLALPGAGQR